MLKKLCGLILLFFLPFSVNSEELNVDMSYHYKLESPGTNQEFSTYYLRVDIIYEKNGLVSLVGVGENKRGDVSPFTGSGVFRGNKWIISLLSSLDTQWDSPYRGYYLLSNYIYLDADLKNGIVIYGNQNVDLGANDFSTGTITRITKEEYDNLGQEVRFSS